MKYLNLYSTSIILLQLYCNISSADVSARDRCSPFLLDHNDGVGYPACGSSMKPLSGPEVGGTVVQIGNGGPRECPLRHGVDIFCRFISDSFSQIFPGILLRMADVVECISPFSGQPINVEVSYVAIPRNCSLENANWITVGEQFQYYGDRAGIAVSDFKYDQDYHQFYNSTPDDSITRSRLFFTNTSIQIEWSAEALHLSTFRDFKPEGFSEYYSTSVAVEILAYNKTKDLEESPFQIIQSIELSPSDYNSTSLTVNNKIISAFMVKIGGSWRTRAAVIQVRVVAYTEQYWNEDDTVERWILAVRSSKMIGILPKYAKNYIGECPFDFKKDCNFADEHKTHPCPPSSDIAQYDNSFSFDENCPWPSGSSTCDPKIDLFDDYVTTCLLMEERMMSANNETIPIYEEIISSYDSICEQNFTGFEDKLDENDGCRCATFHPGAVGCFSDGQTQCCYAKSGGLITQYDDGSGRPKCYPNDSSRLDTINNFLYGDIPFLYCCYLNNDCESYYNGLPAATTDNGYVNPTMASRSFGDPHLTTFDDVDYDFNGYGEYIALCANDEGLTLANLLNYCDPSRERLAADSKTLSIHYRFAPLNEGQNGTVTVGVAIEDPGLNNGARSLVVVPHPTRRLDVYYGADLVQFAKNNRQMMQQFSGTTITKPARINRTALPFFIMNIWLPSGLNIRITETGGVMLPAITRPPELTNIVGLLGRPDGNVGNEFTDTSGHILDIPTDQGLFTPEQTQEIFYNFGQKWMIRRNSVSPRFSSAPNSLFRHLDDFDDYYRPDFEPWFEVPPVMPSNLPSSRPSEPPSPVPTDASSAMPSYLPSKPPSSKPTLSQTDFPSSKPSLNPSTIPTNLPSIQPTKVLSASPTGVPSSALSTTPSTKASDSPSTEPTKSPSGTSTNHPSLQPTNLPSVTDLPSFVPSIFPSEVPTNLPSMQPSDLPSVTSLPLSITSASNNTGSRQLQKEPDVNEVCGDFEDEFIREACIFDFAVIGDADLVNATTTAAVIEKKAATIVNNNPPEILNLGRNQYSEIAINEKSMFKINTTDIDGDSITASIESNDTNNNDLFKLSNSISGVYELFELYFSGSEKPGYFRAHVIVTDGFIPVIVTCTIQVGIAVPSSMTTYSPFLSSPPSSRPSKKSSKKASKKTTNKKSKKTSNKKHKN